ncbi:hypothetical protein SAMN02910406_02213 [Ruminococcus albus]|uniref:DUF5673 domain-containing protein n=2 Tax=Ruminococcus albus TaxID=1264 RepID=A0A1I1LGY3_RUMAL|nr:hypothetical protein SAMN02910406_02213 [Ruminococcus albus]
MIKEYLNPVLGIVSIIILIVYIIFTIIEISKRSKGMMEAENAGGVLFRYKYPEFVKALILSIFGILLSGTVVLLELSGRDVANLTFKNIGAISCYCAMLGLYVTNLIQWLIVYFKYNEFRLCDDCFYLGGAKYDKKKYSYTLEGDTVIFSAKGAKNIEIDIPEKKKKEVLGILGKYYKMAE